MIFHDAFPLTAWSSYIEEMKDLFITAYATLVWGMIVAIGPWLIYFAVCLGLSHAFNWTWGKRREPFTLKQLTIASGIIAAFLTWVFPGLLLLIVIMIWIAVAKGGIVLVVGVLIAGAAFLAWIESLPKKCDSSENP
jgi:hypothetical protein